MAKNHSWKKFENQCARDFGGTGRFPANQGGALDFETPYAVGQCKTMQTKAKRASYTVRNVFGWTEAIAKVAKEKWPVVCVKVRRGNGVKSETLVCVSMGAAEDWIGSARLLYAPYLVKREGASLDALTKAVEALEVDASVIGLRVIDGARSFVAIGRTTFLKTYDFMLADHSTKEGG